MGASTARECSSCSTYSCRSTAVTKEHNLQCVSIQNPKAKQATLVQAVCTINQRYVLAFCNLKIPFMHCVVENTTSVCWKYPNNFVRTVSLIKADFIRDCNGGRPTSRRVRLWTRYDSFCTLFPPLASRVSPLAGYSRFTILSKGLHLLITC